IPSERTCVKVPLTSAGIAAAKILQNDGIDTLGTGLFNIFQAAAASQVGQYAVSMYFNSPKAWFDAAEWADVPQPATEHPMASRHARLRLLYDYLEESTGQKQPQIKTASCVSARECLALYELGAHHLTLNKPTLEDLLVCGDVPEYKKGLWKIPIRKQMEDHDFTWEKWEAPLHDQVKLSLVEVAKVDPQSAVQEEDWIKEVISIDYLESGALDKINELDAVTKEYLGFSLDVFSKLEAQSKEFLEKKMAQVM
ncbi:hypothetical protein TREMEDRAFT_30753, partial [Tremella mesenterica DSM 1558]|uniref:uncharacterized protein n=1 Tax=Tremella mesenterica (strain ATCC 24925 / CBS 8224 / DSM 1558 / NBRC 9311 / NRRL Y-6157 / RJB 2259-6 / UBC 559-6) TaxID=578456 RepID=UPI0003F49B42